MSKLFIPRWITASLLTLGVPQTTAAQSTSCRFTPLTFAAVAGSQNRTYRATSDHWTIELTNYAAPQPATSFSDPPLVATDSGSGKACRFDGGVWAANGFSLDPKAAIMLATEASGSSLQLTVYDLRTCKPLRSIEIKDGVVGFANGGAQIGGNCSGHTVSTCKTVRPVAAADICP